MKKLIKLFVGVFCALLLVTAPVIAADTVVKATNAPVVVQSVAAPAEAWVFTLGGAGVTTTKGNSQSAFGTDFSIGRTSHLLLPFEAGIRQGIFYASPNGGSVVFDTRAYADWTLFTVKKLDLFTGGNIGLTYGNTPLTWTVAPEAGLRYWVKKDVAILGRIDYPFNLNKGRANDTLNYFLGVQVKF
jgi:hypothetical protein